MNQGGVHNPWPNERKGGQNLTNTTRVAAAEGLERRTLLSSWTTVDDFQVAPGHSSGTLGIAADPAGNVYAVGAGLDVKGAPYGFVREKHIGDDQWRTTATLPAMRLYRAAINAAGDLYVQGESSEAWVVLERRAGKTNFEEVDRFDGRLKELTIDEANNVYAVGSNNNQSAVEQHWIVRKRAGGEGPFVTVDDFAQTGAIGTYARGVQVVSHGPSAGVYVVGTFGDPPYLNPDAGGSLVRKSVDGGATWSLVDFYDSDPQGYGGGRPIAVTADTSGNLWYLGGGEYEEGGPNYGFIRRSGDGGATWSNVDSFLASTYALNDIGIDSAGNVFVVGSENLHPEGGIVSFRSIVRSNVGGSWDIVDEFQLAPDKPTYGYGIAFDHVGNVYVCGFANDASAIQHGFIRSAAVGASAPAVYVSGSSWSGTFVAALRTAGLGASGYALLPVGTARNDLLSWTKLNRIQVQFSGDSSVKAEDLSLTGADGHAYKFSLFDFDPTRQVATWLLASPVGPDRLTLSLNGRTWRFDVLPGDVDRGGSVNAADLVKVRNQIGAFAGAADGRYSVFADLNGDGTVNASDLVAVRNRVGYALPPALRMLRPLFAESRIVGRDDDNDRFA